MGPVLATCLSLACSLEGSSEPDVRFLTEASVVPKWLAITCGTFSPPGLSSGRFCRKNWLLLLLLLALGCCWFPGGVRPPVS